MVRPHFPSIVAGVCLLGSISAVQGALLVYDNFDGNTAGVALNGQTTTGLGLTGTYAFNGSTGGQSFTVSSGGLAFGDLSNGLGNSVLASSAGTGATVAVQLALASSPLQGTLYASYLINFTAFTTAGGLAETRVATNSGDAGTATRFRTQADITTGSSAVPGNGYDGSATSGSGTLSLSTTYLIIGRYTNVGLALSAEKSGVGTTFALTEAQYASFLAGGGSDAYLDAATVGTGAGQVSARATDGAVTSGTFSFASGNFYQTGISGTSGSAQTFRYDEVRFGSDLGSVTVPEPGALSTLLVGTTLLAARRRRNAASPR